MILAAAIKYLINQTNEEVVLCGVRHGDILVQLRNLGFKPRTGYVELEQGFITSNGVFLNREEAYKHAKDCGQLSTTTVHTIESHSGHKELFSEDLW